MLTTVRDEEAADNGNDSKKQIAEEYNESKYFQCCARSCGRCWFLFLSFCILAWITHSIVLAGPDPCFLEVIDAQKNGREVECSAEDIAAGQAHWDLAPAFSKSLIWAAISHHTDAWKEHWQRSAPPPPPNFERL